MTGDNLHHRSVPQTTTLLKIPTNISINKINLKKIPNYVSPKMSDWHTQWWSLADASFVRWTAADIFGVFKYHPIPCFFALSLLFFMGVEYTLRMIPPSSPPFDIGFVATVYLHRVLASSPTLNTVLAGLNTVFVGMQTAYIIGTWVIEGRPRATVAALFMFTCRGILGYSTQLPLPEFKTSRKRFWISPLYSISISLFVFSIFTMRIRKNAKISALLSSTTNLTIEADESLLEKNLCQLNQSPWDIITFPSSDSCSSLPHQVTFWFISSAIDQSASVLNSLDLAELVEVSISVRRRSRSRRPKDLAGPLGKRVLNVDQKTRRSRSRRSKASRVCFASRTDFAGADLAFKEIEEGSGQILIDSFG